MKNKTKKIITMSLLSVSLFGAGVVASQPILSQLPTASADVLSDALKLANLSGTNSIFSNPTTDSNTSQTSEHSGYMNILDYGAKADDPNFDNAEIINKMIDNMSSKGGTIYIPTGNFYIKSSIKINRSYVSIVADNSGLRSGIDAGTEKTQDGGGGAKLIAKTSDPMILIESDGPRLSGITLDNFQLKGENAGMGVKSTTDTDRVVIDRMVINNVGIGVELKGADAPVIRDSWIAETRTSIRLIGASQQAEIKDNSLGAQPNGLTLELENADRFNITGNNIYPDGSSAIRLYNPTHGVITGNTISSYYNGIIDMLPNEQGVYGNSNVISDNVISIESWKDNPINRDEKWGIMHIEGYTNRIDGNSIIANGAPENYTGILIMKGNNNRIANNSIGLGGVSSNAKVVVNGSANNNKITDSIDNSEFQDGLNSSNTNRPL